MSLIAKVMSPGPQKPLGYVFRAPLGIDVWEVKPDHLILRGTEAQLERLSRMGYLVEQLEGVERHLSAFATTAAAEQYHSAASMEAELRQLAEARPDIAELKEIGRSIEGRPILASRIGDRCGGVPKLLFMGCHHAREWIAVEVPLLLAKELVERAAEAPIAGWLTNGEVWVAYSATIRMRLVLPQLRMFLRLSSIASSYCSRPHRYHRTAGVDDAWRPDTPNTMA